MRKLLALKQIRKGIPLYRSALVAPRPFLKGVGGCNKHIINLVKISQILTSLGQRASQSNNEPDV